jgi:endonuclease YncB( thermonuclease family)
MLILRSISVLVALALATSAALGTTRDGQVRVVDGDTLVWQGEKVRLFGIDAPEKGQTCDRSGQSWNCGTWSAMMLERAIGAGPVECRRKDTDRYRRMVAICTSAGVDLSHAQVQAGAAQAYTRYSAAYAKAEAAARTARAGLWAGRMVTPSDHRKAGQAKAPLSAPQSVAGACAIKGNINGTSRIYHMPGQRDYAATRIDSERGEAWFCSEAEARRAGFRPARR